MDMNDRIQQRMTELGYKSVDVVNRIGLSKGTVSQWLNGHTKPRGKNLLSLSDILRCTPEWLQFGVGQDISTEQRFSNIPVLNVELAAGPGMSVDLEQIQDRIPISSEWIFENHLSESSLAVVKISGDSMLPRLMNGDMLLIDTADKRPISGKVYAIATDDELRVKRLHKRTDGSWIISSDNKHDPAYQDEIVSYNNFERLRIIGRAVKVLMGDI